MPGRKFNAGDYRFGFNGKEMDNEVSGNGNSYDYGFRIYNPRLGRFLSVDPLTASYPWYTPYHFAGNKPIWAIDLDGLEEYYITDYYNTAGELYKTETRVVTADITSQIKVHRSQVVYSEQTNGIITAEVSYVGTSTGKWKDKGVGPFRSIQEKNKMGQLKGFGTKGTASVHDPLATPGENESGLLIRDKGERGTLSKPAGKHPAGYFSFDAGGETDLGKPGI